MERQLSVIEHLEELRRRLIVSLVALGAATVAAIPFSRYLLKLLKIPAQGAIEKLAFFSPEEAFVIYMKIAFLAGFILSFPVIAYQLWAFIAPAISGKFKRRASYFIVSVSFVFVCGCLFCYYIMLPSALSFLLNLGQEDLVPVISASKYISFVTSLILISGLVFQMPVLSFFFTRMGLVNAALMRRHLGIATVIIAIIAAVLTPTGDAFNMLILALPMMLLYVLSIWVSYFAERLGKKDDAYGQA